ncbi:hypothetical protein I4F81_009644 [Pyropia yezoensis]|uniref:Uncharacterized protein n=1 Tax=Pyropia yezoensis TaxID=2788 RepID=A0ACC3CA91_PYRYE|nr:hypothetical protein I4F81_009644 [Neopyropia yezoensis]
MLVLCTQLAVRCTSPSVAARWLPVPPALLVLTRLSVYFFISCVCAPPFPFLFMGLGQSLAALEELVLTVIWSTVGAVDAFLGWLLTPLVLAAHVVAVAWTWLNWAVARAWQPVARYGWHAVVLSVIVYKVGGRVARWRADTAAAASRAAAAAATPARPVPPEVVARGEAATAAGAARRAVAARAAAAAALAKHEARSTSAFLARR